MTGCAGWRIFAGGGLLFFIDATEPEVRLWAAGLAEHYGSDNVTDTVYRAMKDAYALHCNR